MNWYIIDKDYVQYLMQFDSRIGYVEYGPKVKLHVGILLNINQMNYYVPISSPKPKHYKMSDSLDFQKLTDPGSGKLYAVLNINNMIPVPEPYAIQVKYNQISRYAEFPSEADKTNYIYLLQKEKAIIDRISAILCSKAENLYLYYRENPDSAISRRCCNFPLLEEKAALYK